MSSIEEKKIIGEAGAWHAVLMQELHRKHGGGNYHRGLVSISLRHIKHHCSNEAYLYYLNLHDGLCRLPPC